MITLAPGRGVGTVSGMESLKLPETTVVRLDNGLEILVVPEHSSPVVSVQAWVRVGSVHEAEYLGAGISHLIEHLVFKGTRRLGPGEAARVVQDAGGYLNAYTSFERTVYWIEAPAESLAAALDVTTELVFHPLFPEGEFEREKEVIRREIAMGKDDPRRVLSEELFATAYLQHPCRQSVIGALGAFNRLGLDDVRLFHARHYVPNNVFFVVAGDVDVDAVRAMLDERTGELAPRGRAQPVMPVEPALSGMRRKDVAFATDVGRLQMAWHIPAQWHPDVPALDLLGRIMGSGESGRLFRRLREEAGLAHDVSAGVYTPGFGGLFFAGAEAEPETLAKLEDGIRHELAVLETEGVTQAEVEKARCGALADFLRGMETTNGLASQVGGSWLQTGTTDFSARYAAGLREVGAEKIRAVAERYLSPERAVVVRMLPKTAQAAPRKAVARAGAAAEATELVTLPNGLRVLFGRDARLPLVSIHAACGGGASADPMGQGGLAAWLAAGLWKGTDASGAAALAERIEGRGGSFGAAGGNNSITLSVEMLAEDLGLAMETLAEVMHGARFPADAMERERAMLVAGARERAMQPLSAAASEARRLLFRHTCFEQPSAGDEKSLAALEVGALGAHWRRMRAAGNTVLGVFGDFDPQKARADVERLFGSLPPGGGLETPAAASWAALPGGERVELRRPKEQAVLVVLFPTGGLHDPDNTAIELIDEASGDMGSRFFLRIREEQGLAYFVAPFQIKGPRLGAAGFYLGTSDDKLDHAESELLDEIRRLADGGLEEAEMRRAQQTWRGKFLLQNQSADARGRHAVVDTLLGLGHDHATRQLDEMRALTPDAVKAAAGRVFSANPVIVRVRPGG